MASFFQNLQYFIAILSIAGYFPATDSALKLVNVVFRHGDRTPSGKREMYPLDPYINNNFDPPGYGMLTLKGEHTAFKLGSFLSVQYKSFLGPRYSPRIIVTRSTDYNRTKESLKFVLSAMYPGVEDKHTVVKPRSRDMLLLPQFCPLYGALYLQSRRKGLLELNKLNNSKYMNYLKLNTGKKISYPLDLYQLYVGLEAEKFMGLHLPNWTNMVFPNGLLLDGVVLEHQVQNRGKRMIQRNGGVLLKLFMENIDNAVRDKNGTSPKMYLYSAHDITIVAVLQALGVYFPHSPQYSSALIIELHEINGSHFVQVFYRHGVSGSVLTRQIPKCNFQCELPRFRALIKDNIPARIGGALCGRFRKALGPIYDVINDFKNIFS